MTGGIVKTEIINEKWDGHTYWIKASIKSDPDDVIETIGKLKKNRGLDDTIEKLEEEHRYACSQIEDLKSRLEDAQENLLQLNRDYQKAQDIVSAGKLLEKGIQQRKDDRISEAIDSFTSGIEMKPSYMLYIERGKTYLKIKRFSQALDDFDSAIKMKPDNGKAYFHKGIAFFKQGNKKKGIQLIKKSAGLRSHTARLWLKSKNIH